MFNAYVVSSIATKLPLGIESVASHDRTLYGGTKNGSLVTYSPSPDQPIYQLYVCRSFLSKSVSQLKVIGDLQLLIALSDGLITVHDCTQVNYPSITSLQKLKGVNFFAAELITGINIKNVNDRKILCLCAVVRKKLYFYYWQNREFHELPNLADVSYSDNIRIAVWCPDGHLALAIRDEYCVLSVFGNLAQEESAGVTKTLFITGNKSADPIIKSLNDLKLLGFCRDETLIFVTWDGRSAAPLGYSNIRWSQIPSAIEYDYPFLLALFAGSVEIRSIKPPQLIQTIDLQKPQIISWSSRCCLHVVSNPAANLIDLYCLDALPLLKQNIQHLVKEKEYQLACQLAENVADDKHEDEKLARIKDIRTLYAFHLYCQRRFKEAMEIFGDINAEVLYVIGLFPDLLPDEVRQRVNYPGPLPSDFAKNDQIQGLHALAEYLSMVRTNIARQLDAHEKRKNKSIFSSSEFFGGDHHHHHDKISTVLDEKVEIQQKNLLQIVDTTLLKCYLQTNDMLVASLLRLPDNRCDVAESEKILLKHKKYNELFLLYERKEMHASALELLKTQHKVKDSPLRGINRSIHYLQNLGNKHLSLIFQYSRWILKENPDEALKIFTDDCDEVKGLDRSKVVDFLNRESPESLVPYLEHIITVFNDKSSGFRDALVKQCFTKVRNEMSHYIRNVKSQSLASPGQEPGELGEMRLKLLEYLELASPVVAEILLNEIPEDIMHDERALLYGKTGKHAQAIAIYTNVLHDYKKAEAYCLHHYRASISSFSAIPSSSIIDSINSGSNTFLIMLSSYAKPEEMRIGKTLLPKPPPNVPLAMKVLQNYAQYMDVAQALNLLPLRIRFEELWVALEAVVHNVTRKRRDAQIKSSLNQSLLLLTQSKRVKAQNVKIQINYHTMCAICGKRIGASAFAYMKNRTLVHYYCLPSKTEAASSSSLSAG